MTSRAPVRTCLIGLFLLLAPATFAADPSWSLTFGTPGDEAINHLEPLSDGGLVVAGATGVQGLVARLDAAGDPLWLKTYDTGPLNDIRPTPGGGFIAAGHAGTLIYVVKLDDDGNPDWQQTHGYSGSLRFATIQLSADGGYFVGAEHGDKAAIVKLESNGDFLWRREVPYTYGNPCLIPTPQGGVKLVRNESPTPWVQEFDATGRLIQDRNFYMIPYDVSIMGHVLDGECRGTRDGGLIATGRADVLNPDGMSGHWEAGIAKLGADYSGEWSVLVGQGLLQFYALSITERADRGYVATLECAACSPPRCYVVRLGTAGQLSWQWQSLGMCGVIREADDGGLFLTGYRYVSGAGKDAWVAKLGPSGTLPGACEFWTESTLRALPGYVNVLTASRLPSEPLSEEAPVSVRVRSAVMEWAEQCSGQPVLGPDDEIAPRGSSTPLIFSDRTTLEWEDPAGGGVQSFNLYLGSIADLPGRYITCLEPEIPVPTFEHTDVPPLGSTWYYLVTGNTSFGETLLGRDGFGRPRPNTNPCF